MQRYRIIGFVFLGLLACGKIKDKTKETINKTGEIVGSGTSEFFEGVVEGVDKTLSCTIELSDGLKAQGVELGKFFIESKEGKDNVLNVYLIFNQEFNQVLLAKVYDKNNLEMGRANLTIDANKDHAQFYVFEFPVPTQISAKSIIRLN